MSKNKFLSSVVLTGFMLVFCVPQSVFAEFKDVPEKHPFYEAITTLESQGVIKKNPNNTFNPDENVKRVEFLAMVFKDIGYKPTTKTIKTAFSDVPEDSWFSGYVAKALELGSITFNPNIPKFFPDQPLTKIEALKILMPLEGIPAPFTTDKNDLIFKDINTNAPYSYLIRAAQKSGIYIFNPDSKFYPFKNLTRGEAAELIYRAGTYRKNFATSDNYGQNFNTTNKNNGFTKAEFDLINNPKFPIFVDAWEKVNEEYYDQANIDKNKMVYQAIGGMVQSLNDPYSVFEAPEEAHILEENLNGTFEGIGSTLDILDKDIIIVSVLKKSPAYKSGLKPGDIIKKVDAKDVTDMSIEQVVKLIKGPAGSNITLTVLRDKKTLQIQITREKITLDSVLMPEDAKEQISIPNSIGYININQFIPTTGAEFTKILKNTLAKKPKGIILDLRDNPGGYLNEAYSVLNHFIAKGQTVIQFNIGGKKPIQLSEGPGEAANIPMIILVNKYTASASEVVAGALQDYKIAKLLGEQTFGKGTVQTVTDYPDGSLLKLSIAHWFTPLKRDINKVGLTPDIVITMSKDDLEKNTDPQLERAIEELQ